MVRLLLLRPFSENLLTVLLVSDVDDVWRPHFRPHRRLHRRF